MTDAAATDVPIVTGPHLTYNEDVEAPSLTTIVSNPLKANANF